MSIVANLKAPNKSVSWNKSLIVKATPSHGTTRSSLLMGNQMRRKQMKNKTLWKRQPRRLPLMKYRKERFAEANAVNKSTADRATKDTERKPRMLPLAKYRPNEENSTTYASTDEAEDKDLHNRTAAC
ncbi:hypothetical protein ACHAW6_015187 [Cyclotella cf. meneghiniana]